MSEIDNNLKFYERPVFINALLLILNTIFFVFKLIFGILTNSLALQADAFDSMTDIIMCLIAFIGILFSKKGISGAQNTTDAEREQLKVFQDRGMVIVVIDEKDLDFVADGGNFINLLRQRYEKIRLDLKK